MSAQRQINWISEDEYLRREEISLEKHEWFRGEVREMECGSFRHTTICSNLNCATGNALRGKKCVALNSEMRVKVAASGLYTYPDALIFCPPSRFEGAGDHTLLTPKVLFEVLSPSTQNYDRTDKFALYQGLESLTDYVLIEAERVSVEHFSRAPDGWLLRSYGTRDDVLRFPDLEIELPLRELYEDLEVPDRADAPQIAPREE